jgi:hypothetical protein
MTLLCRNNLTRLAALAAGLSCLPSALAAPIETRLLDPMTPAAITLSTGALTTLKFPQGVNGVLGLGLSLGTDASKATGADVQVLWKPGEPFVSLYALSKDAREQMTVILGGEMYVFELETGNIPDVAVALVRAPQGEAGLAAQPVTAAQIVQNRPRQDVDLYLSLCDRATLAPLYKLTMPELYRGYEARSSASVSDGDAWKTTVTRIHRFPQDDALVIEGTVENKGTRPLRFDTRATAVKVANEVHPVKLTRVMQPIPAGKTVPIQVVIQGEPDGVSRANLSLDNDYKLYIGRAYGEAAGVWNPVASVEGK